MAWGSPPSRGHASHRWHESVKGLLYRGRERVDLAAGAGDGRRPLDDAGLRRRLATTHGLDLRVTVHGRARRRTLDAALDFPTHDDGSITEHLSRGREASLDFPTHNVDGSITGHLSRRREASLDASHERGARQIPGTGPSLPTHTAARRRFLVNNAAVPRPWPRRPAAHCARAPRATGTRASPNENRLVAPRAARGRLSRRRRRFPEGGVSAGRSGRRRSRCCCNSEESYQT